ncbi:hypothetical protein IC582_020086 [Cucumis melo]|uniref:S-protein homolog n=1 Tax=Cucumis melo var. makuwa TaxID=1194695 RepID=A0A5A7VL75_CUCMM|nr:uncharacterized protein E6C27_scaffold138G001560 [Cucumis melo var. makuwa]
MYEEKMNLVVVILLVLVAVAVVQPCTAVPLPLPKWRIHVVNGLNNETLLVHCKSKDDDLGIHNLVSKGEEFQWTFKVNFFGTTLFWCYLQKPNFSVSFESFWVEKSHPWLNSRCFHNDCIWIAKDDAVYLRNNLDNVDERIHEWNKIV